MNLKELQELDRQVQLNLEFIIDASIILKATQWSLGRVERSLESFSKKLRKKIEKYENSK